ncbi:ribonucleotide reductase assembly protein NrdI [Fructilactobacillus lindneri]|nr:class Ib ribonucleoside-diphosphate reductase assembly flavoprotein NrdI [Fructilactobacillus lindneri]ANZ57517.1 ribonucleotide reductase assembly protein NrdI [Fructilactobacillus lindneri]ANZ58785.1 ribonucleotide reductase assembly protein NrdI [Fructilactobacillus lindneri]POG97787.1 ribonucleotide reductase assembly protein NrdI [Fructilactobacillus lindneri]POG99119.1 ribonucleotide reductase assembly protein NrdI [Fructilactobacillus lindneri]POH01282.1 ribonucleotide reductase asse
MKPIRILFISIEGNTRSFIEDLTEYAKKQHQENAVNPLISTTEISDQTDFADETSNYFVFVPTYLDGGDGVDTGVKELMTNTMGEYLAYHQNASYCLGVIGSGNKNFNLQYCLTAKRYSRQFQVPFITDYELRGTNRDVIRIYTDLVERTKEVEHA